MNVDGTVELPDARVAVHVGQALLHNAEQRKLKVGGQPAEFRRYLEIDLQTAPFLQALHVPIDRLRQSRLIQQWRVQQVRRCANFRTQLCQKILGVGEHLGSARLLPSRTGESRECHAQGGYHLSSAVVQFTGNATSLFILTFQ